MELVLASLHLSWMGGATTYLVTIAPALQRLGHDVTLYSPDAGDTAELARSRGICVAERGHELPHECDAVLVQDTVMALELADRYRRPQLFVSHAAELDLAIPPQVHGLTAAIVAMNDRVAARARALATEVPVVRLRQPIDVERFGLRGPLRQRPALALLIGNYLRGERKTMLTSTLDNLGIRWRQAGRYGDGPGADAAAAIADADIVIGHGRSILEAMSCGRPAYVFDHTGADGWVTAETYPALERDGFAGLAFDRQLNPELLRADLAAYDPRNGLVGRDLAFAHHSAFQHARELSELFKLGAGRTARRVEDARELARLVRSQWHADWRANQMAHELEAERARLLDLEARLASADAAAQAARERFDALASTRPWRTVQALLRPLDWIRRRERATRATRSAVRAARSRAARFRDVL